ncbi:HlyD family type I secretion periplasmic adaptor subunit [Burkholderia territorii]|uniref:HlyD family type I secretion periplasmic adaptor subunit n=1 Tax=Burkholderia territorii TaxID=1503055 RepID=UPI00145486C9|nr:HlyD family type I secretion periplasmic adaptor subunit [Burkholderia territorii]MBM2774422.1 HlyD family type I secretion periplasmic adaptor subunit [Burkholderia territorii]VWB82827.1 HlyD family type I secretion membrane fusion protein [Burkholderia territorii]
MITMKIQALGDLLRRYRSVFGAAWAVRAQMDGEHRSKQELAFLPASLELIETPCHPAPRWTLRIIMVLALLALLIAIFGRLDIVVSAKGKLIPGERVKIIQPAVTGVVRRIFVNDGERVNAGQPLIVLDATQAAADADKARSSRVDAALSRARAQALLGALTSGRSPVLYAVPDVPLDQQQQAQRFADGIYLEYRNKLEGAEAEQLKRVAELATTRREIDKLRATAPLARDEANAYRSLAGDRYVAQYDYLRKEQTAIEQEHDLAAQQSHAREIAAAIAEQRAMVGQITAQFKREQLDALDKANQQFAQSSDEETKAVTRQKLLTLTAPVAGTVQQLSAHTLGGVVTAAQAVMEIVPDDAVEVEAYVENKDVGFVDAGQDVTVKVEAFPYTRYGYVKGTIESVSNDAVQDRKRGLTFMARVKLEHSRMRIENKWIDLTPGMEVTAEVKTGRRSVAGYFLDPLIRTASESLHER